LGVVIGLIKRGYNIKMEANTTSRKIRIASFDPGKKNFAFCVEEFDTTTFDVFSNAGDGDPSSRYRDDGSPSPAFEKTLETICTEGEIIEYANIDLTAKCAPGYFDYQCLANLTAIFDSYTRLWDTCDVFLIEMQMAFRGKYNTMALKIAQHCWSFFYLMYGPYKHIVSFPAYYKTRILGAVKIKSRSGRWVSIDKPARKKWCEATALAILRARRMARAVADGNARALEVFERSNKKDDLADVICQLQAYKILTYARGIP
jgi:hypothetical protein